MPEQHEQNLETVRQELLRDAEKIEAPPEPRKYNVLRRIVENPDNFVTISFGGGSMPAIAGNCALYSVLEDLDILPHVREVWGVSAGSIVGASMAAGTTSREILDFAYRINPKKVVDVPFWDVIVKGLYNFIRHRQLPEGFMRGDRFIEQIDAGIRIDTFEECRIPLFIITCTDDGHARKIVLKSGNIIHAIRASMCIPGVMLPVLAKDGDHGYLDGGLVEKTPLRSIIEQHARDDRSEQLVVLATHFDDTGRITVPRGFAARFTSTIARLEESVWRGQLALATEEKNRRVLVMNARLEFSGMFDVEVLRLNYLSARRTFKEQLSNAGIAARFLAS